jgi:predicted phosphate transport protein (TIGR00153 family)
MGGNVRLFRKRPDFYSLLLEQARCVDKGMSALVLYMKDPQYINGERVLRLEEEADDIRARVATELNQAFVTPIDREDINNLSRSIDDIIDYAKTTVEEMMALQVSPTPDMIRMAEGLHEAATAIAEAVGFLKKDLARANERVIFAKKRENFVEHCYREALVELFKGENVVGILKVREIYRHLSNAADRGDEAANIIGDVIVKTT